MRIGALTALLAAAAMPLAWLLPGSPLAAVLGWFGVFGLVAAADRERGSFRLLYLCGLISYGVGFYWLFETILLFGGFPFAAALGIWFLFISISAIQFIVYGAIFSRLKIFLEKFSLCGAVSWIAAEKLWVRIFPWEPAHTQLASTWFAQSADLLGTPLITFVMFWLLEAVLRCSEFDNPRSSRLSRISPPLIMLLGLSVYGYSQEQRYKRIEAPTQQVGVVQANISLEKKHDVAFFSVNRKRYEELSRRISGPAKLIVWPESVITDLVPTYVGDARFSSKLPYFGDGSAFLVGAVTFDEGQRIFNSSVAIYPDASVPSPYHKMILMPFGEYTPFSSIFPWLKEINSTAADFTPGDGVKVLSIPMKSATGSDYTLKLSPLICYEDVLPDLASEAARNGAELLVNQTNDAWFGNTIAPYQHQQIAAFRAIENRRYLIRSTNTGYTSIINPLGKDISNVMPFSEGTLSAEVKLLNTITPFSRWHLGRFWNLVAYLSLFTVLLGAIPRRSTWK